MSATYYPKPGFYRFLMDNPPPNPGPATKFATNNGVGMQVTAEGSDEDDRLRQRWYVDLNSDDGTGVKIYTAKPDPTGPPALVFETVNDLDCVFLVKNKEPKEWRLKYVNESDPKKNDFNFYVYSKDLTEYLAIQDYGVVVKTGDPKTKGEYWHFVGAAGLSVRLV